MDLKLENGDLVLSNKSQLNTESFVNITIYDILPSTFEEELHTILKRTFVTPLGYIRLRVIDSLGSRNIDYEYGDGIYMTLSQPMKSTLIQQIERYIIDCIEQLPLSIRINKYQIQVINIDAVQVRINYSLNNNNDISETTILIEV